MTKQILKHMFAEFQFAGVSSSQIVLKLHMITSGNRHKPAPPEEIADATISVISEMPTDIPLVVFLSGGQSESAANMHLNAIARAAENSTVSPKISFSFGRSLQRAALRAWQVSKENNLAAQTAFIFSLKAATAATQGALLSTNDVCE